MHGTASDEDTVDESAYVASVHIDACESSPSSPLYGARHYHRATGYLRSRHESGCVGSDVDAWLSGDVCGGDSPRGLDDGDADDGDSLLLLSSADDFPTSVRGSGAALPLNSMNADGAELSDADASDADWLPRLHFQEVLHDADAVLHVAHHDDADVLPEPS